jgi:1-acyl-sn-glycerol-3-phosphate acyltransferase
VKAPIIPTAIFGTERLPFNGAKGRRTSGRHEVVVRIGAPFQLPSQRVDGPRPKLAELTGLLMAEIAHLLPSEYRGVYADRVSDELSLPGRAR